MARGISVRLTVLMLFIFSAEFVTAVDLCLFFGHCGNENNRSPDQHSIVSNHDLIDDDVVFIDNEWMEKKSLNNNQLYHVASNTGAMDWFDANAYCQARNSYLVEPLTQDENDFLVRQVQKLDDANWWIGLRETEKCGCVSGNIRFESFFVYDTSLSRSNQDGMGVTYCPVGYEKICDGSRKQWRWVYFGTYVPNVNWRPDEPNGAREHCACMWHKDRDFRWSDWMCKQTTESGKPFKPICQKSKFNLDNNDDVNNYYEDDDANEYYYEDDDDIYDYYVEDDGIDLSVPCVVPDRVFKGQILSVIRRVSAYDLCLSTCSRNLECNAWSWSGPQRNLRCVLLSVLNSGGDWADRTVIGAYSGTMEGGCRDSVLSDFNEGRQEVNAENACVEYGIIYTASRDKIATVDNIQNPEECRQSCINFSSSGCLFYSWVKKSHRGGGGGRANGRNRRRRRRYVCTLSGSRDGGNIRFNKDGVSGTIRGACSPLALSELVDCVCAVAGEDDSIVTGTRSVSDDFTMASEALHELTCPRQSVKRCGKLTATVHGNGGVRSTRGEPCVDYDIAYDGGDVIHVLDNVNTKKKCRQKCLASQRRSCEYYTWDGPDSRRCSLLRGSAWVPRIARGVVSGNVKGDCKDQDFGDLGFCECYSLKDDNSDYGDDYEYYDIDLISAGLIDVRSNVSDVCKGELEGRRCYSIHKTESKQQQSIAGGLRSGLVFDSASGR